MEIHTHANAKLLPSEKMERLSQLTLVSQAALHTNLSDPHVGQAVATLLEVITEISDDLTQTLQQAEMKKAASK